jgi:hypothetical protein
MIWVTIRKRSGKLLAAVVDSVEQDTNQVSSRASSPPQSSLDECHLLYSWVSKV